MLVGLVLGTIWVVVLIEGAGVSKWELDSEIVLRMRICDWGETQLEGLGKPGCSRNQLHLQLRCHKGVAQVGGSTGYLNPRRQMLIPITQ